jgi:hypothetical protein
VGEECDWRLHLVAGKILILVEGDTEFKFVNRVLNSHLIKFHIQAVPTIVTSRENPTGPDYKGGTVKYSKIKKQISQLLRDSSVELVTTMLDYYKLHRTFPVPQQSATNCYERVEMLEQAISKDIGENKRFVPYLQLHEFEGLIFSAPLIVAENFANSKELRTELTKIRGSFNTPEEIDDDPSTCPNRRLSNLCKPGYRKSLHGFMLTEKIGLTTIRQECPHFDDWISKLETLASS